MCTADADCVPILPSGQPSPSPYFQPYPSYPQNYPQYPQPYPVPGPSLGGYVYPYYEIPPVEAPAPEVPQPGDRSHDGLFLRLAVGLGGRAGTMSTAAALFQFELGYTVARQFVLAGGWYGADGLSQETFTLAGRRVDTGANAVNIMGGTAVFYVDPHKGLHFDLLAGLAVVVVNRADSGLSSSHTGLGFGGGGGGGYEWWVSRNWSLGVLGRIAYAQARLPLDGESLGNADAIDLHLVTVGVLFAATYN
jgi:hypothetical protein